MVVVGPEELELLDESSFFEQEMRERLKNADRKMKIIFFIFQLITKYKINACFTQANSGTYQRITIITVNLLLANICIFQIKMNFKIFIAKKLW